MKSDKLFCHYDSSWNKIITILKNISLLLFQRLNFKSRLVYLHTLILHTNYFIIWLKINQKEKPKHCVLIKPCIECVWDYQEVYEIK